MVKKIDHIGMAVRSLTEARRFYEEVLGLTCDKVEEVLSQKVRIAFFTVGEVHIELLEPTSSDSPIAKFIETRGEGIHHIAYEVDDLRKELVHVSEEGCRLIHETPIAGAGGKEIAFLHPKSTFGVLTELAAKG
ncbi:MAG: methylmalonyl-CoA epimerase [Proteobacteria bacterium]|nr:methylmalonyl-CoA epimerase [Desulfobulbaceae bacterium]MBU4152696.1 methylmalonyl-CoA epimerase [Pseudomonadota bacterium]